MNLNDYYTLGQLEDATGLKWSVLRGRLKILGIEGILVNPRLRLYPKSCVADLINFRNRKKEGP
jgi:hypothetical protein